MIEENKSESDICSFIVESSTFELINMSKNKTLSKTRSHK